MSEADRREWLRLEAKAKDYRLTAAEASRLWVLRVTVDLMVD